MVQSGAAKELPLRARFESFVRTMAGFEDIDELLRNQQNLQGKMRADYFFASRQVIVEQKTLQSNPLTRPQKFAERVMRERWIVLMGTRSTKCIFSGQPDGASLQRRLMLNIARIIDDDVAKADKQTRDTRLIFSRQDAAGIIVFLNEGAAMLTPDVIRFALSDTLQKKNEDGGLRYMQNDGVIVISEAQNIAIPGISAAYPIHTYTTPGTARAGKVIAFSEALMRGWAQFNRAPLIKEMRASR